MMGRSHLAANAAVTVAGLAWVGALRDPASTPAQALDGWLHGGARWVLGIVDRPVPSWIGERPVSGAAQAVWEWLVPVWDRSGAVLVGYAVLGAMLLWLGSLAPDLDSRSSILGRRLPFAVPGPHRGLLHTDWALISLLAVAVLVPVAQPLFWLWLGAWLHCELDGLSRAGRVRFYPLTKHRVIDLAGGEACVVRSGRAGGGLYRSGSAAETALLASIVTACGAATAAALLL